MSDVDWIDLPDDNYIAILGYETQNTCSLDTSIREYNKIPKDQFATLSCRIKKLNEIIALVQDWTENRLEAIDKRKHLLWISEIAAKKKNYLIQLLNIYENELHLGEAQNAYHNDISSLCDLNKIPIVLNNHHFFSLKMREYWGDFWLETLDPCHRRVTPFLNQWNELKKLNPQMPHFFLWLETQHIPKYVPRVTYLKGEELEKRRLAVQDGLFWEKANSKWVLANFNIPSKRYLFSIDLTGEIYAAEDGIGISHSSFTCGKPVLGGGLLKINQGQLVTVALESGHYMPTVETGHQILKIFEEKGALLPSDLELVFFHDRNKYTIVLATNPLPTLDQFREILESTYSFKLRGCHESSTV
jgi:hypothetical protein